MNNNNYLIESNSYNITTLTKSMLQWLNYNKQTGAVIHAGIMANKYPYCSKCNTINLFHGDVIEVVFGIDDHGYDVAWYNYL